MRVDRLDICSEPEWVTFPFVGSVDARASQLTCNGVLMISLFPLAVIQTRLSEALQDAS